VALAATLDVTHHHQKREKTMTEPIEPVDGDDATDTTAADEDETTPAGEAAVDGV
jgi:hypothetical protein